MRQIVADATGRPVQRLQHARGELPRRRDARRRRCRLVPDARRGRARDAGRGRARPSSPIRRRRRTYRELLAIYRDLYPALRATFARLAAYPHPTGRMNRLFHPAADHRRRRRRPLSRRPSWAGRLRTDDPPDRRRRQPGRCRAGAGRRPRPRLGGWPWSATRTPGRCWARASRRRCRRAETIVLDHPKADEATAELLQERARHADAPDRGRLGHPQRPVQVRHPPHRPPLRRVRHRALDGRLRHHHGLDHPRRLQAQPAGPGARRACSSTSRVLAAAPSRMMRAGLGDTVCRTTAQVDWLLSHLLLDTVYAETPYRLMADGRAPPLRPGAPAARGRPRRHACC